MSNVTDTPPHNLEAEQATLGSMLIDRDAIARVVKLLQPEDFSREAHRRIYESIIDLFDRAEPVDLITVTERLHSKELLDEIGGATYITSLLNCVPTAANVEYYARIVLQKSMLRREIDLHTKAAHRLQSGDDRDKVAADVQSEMEEIEKRGTRSLLRTGDKVDLASLLSRISDFMRRFVVFASTHQPVAVALWVVMTHVVEAFEVVGYLVVTSPEKRSAKSRLLELLDLLVARPWRVIRPSEAVTFRKLAADRPTLLIDEYDAIFRDKALAYEGIRAVLNAGYRRGATVPRLVGDAKNMKVADFRVFGPKALAGIGDLPDTIADRSIPIPLRRRTPHERIERFRYRDILIDAHQLQDKISLWARQVADDISDRRPQIPDVLNDRQTEIWEPLLIIADLAGGVWPRIAREAAVALHNEPVQEETVGVSLLQAIREIFAAQEIDRISTSSLLKALVDRDDGPWPEWWGKQVVAGEIKSPSHRLGRLLRPFGIRSQSIRVGGDTPKGFYLADFQDAFSRYLAPTSLTAPHSPHPASAAELRSIPDPPHGGVVAIPETREPSHQERVVADVAILPRISDPKRQADAFIQEAVQLFGGVVVEIKPLAEKVARA